MENSMKKKIKIILKLLTIICIAFAFLWSGIWILHKTENFIQNTKDEFMNKLDNLSAINVPLQNIVQDSLSSVDLNLSINGYPIDVDMRYRDNTVYAKSLNTDVGNYLTLKVPEDSKVYINKEEYTEEYQFDLDSLSQSNQLEIYIDKQGEFRRIIIPTLPSGFPKYETGSYELEKLSGYYYGDFTESGNSYVYKMDICGNLVYYYYSTKQTGSVFNFKKNLVENNEIIYSFFEPVDNQNKMEVNGILFGEVVLLNEYYEEITRIKMLPTEKVPQANYVENHDYLILGKNHYVLIAEVLAPFQMEDGSVRQMRCPYIQEIIDGEVVFEWLSKDYEEFDKSYMELGVDGEDYMHINSIAIDPKDNNFIISNRNQDSISKINRETGDVLWTLGGKNDDFNLSKEQEFSRQHYACFDFDGNLMFFNNDNNKGASSVLKFQLNEKELKVESFEKYSFGNKFSPYCGNVQQISETLIFIGWGITNGEAIGSVYDIEKGMIVSEILFDKQNTYRTMYFE